MKDNTKITITGIIMGTIMMCFVMGPKTIVINKEVNRPEKTSIEFMSNNIDPKALSETIIINLLKREIGKQEVIKIFGNPISVKIPVYSGRGTTGVPSNIRSWYYKYNTYNLMLEIQSNKLSKIMISNGNIKGVKVPFSSNIAEAYTLYGEPFEEISGECKNNSTLITITYKCGEGESIIGFDIYRSLNYENTINSNKLVSIVWGNGIMFDNYYKIF